MTSFYQIFKKLSPSSQQSLTTFFDNWSKKTKWSNNNFVGINADIVINNLKNDHFLPPFLFEEIIQFILEECANGADCEQIIMDLQNQIYTDYKCKGKKVTGNYPKVVGTVISKPDLINRLLDKRNGYGFDKPDDVDKFLKTSPKDYSSDQKQILLKEAAYLIWVTWNELNVSGDSFEFSKYKNTEEIAIALGLPDSYFNPRNQPLRLLRFNTLKIGDIHCPTFTDADLNNDKFRVAPENENDNGLTKPSQPITLASGFPFNRPEGVIRSQDCSLGCLKEKIEN